MTTGLAIGLALLLVSFAAADQLPPNELGRVMILAYHKIDYPEARWTRTPENFRRDLETLYAKSYRLISLRDLLDRRIALPAGTTPVVLTFDDSSPGQFRYLEQNGTLEIDPESAVGILEAFTREHPDFGRGATFYVLPGANPPNRLFNQPALEGKKLQYLARDRTRGTSRGAWRRGDHDARREGVRVKSRCIASAPSPRSSRPICSSAGPTAGVSSTITPRSSWPRRRTAVPPDRPQSLGGARPPPSPLGVSL